ncbi:MAG: bifunctional 5,10-methylenetetrahydrofolate dehydrogenase/5,10-methenyltetrahydrofolate cyclohydrolase [Phycisphaerae bacterium]|nr:bifunctional 5,10-methylenetetrahydrofolate dehydrogenase/5,10-methenyltetrahydrofolate cyclohydrolase [Phycisphaerae bacterium]
MTARILDGQALGRQYREQIARRVETVRASGREVRLDAVLTGTSDTAARVYAQNQARTCEAMGIRYRLHEVGEAPGEEGYQEVAGRVLLLNTQPEVSAIMVHLPLAPGVDPYRVQRLIAPEKDVEGVNPANIGNVVYGRSSLAPCTGLAAVAMVEHALGASLRGKIAVVVGAGDVVGKPIAVLLMRREATVVSCNKWTPEIGSLTRRADILVAAAGVPGLIRADMVKAGAVVVDVGVSRVPGPDGRMRTVGDVEFDEVKEIAGWISPVPGGVGPMTVSMLLLNVVEAAERMPVRVG